MRSLLNAPPGRRNRILLVSGALLLILLFLFSARAALFPFMLGLVLAYLLTPLVRKLEGGFPAGWPEGRRRLLAVGQVYVLMLAVLFLLGGFALPALFRQVNIFILRLPEMVAQAQDAFAAWAASYQSNVPPEVQVRIEEATASIGEGITGALQGAALRTAMVVSQTFSLLLGFFTVPVWLFYILKDHHQAQQAVSRFLPQGAQETAREIVSIVDRTLTSYLRGQLLLGVIVGTMTGIGLTIMGVPFAPVLAIIAGVTEMIPFLGPILGAIPAIVVTLANEPDKVVLVALLFVGVQFVENTLLVPRVQGHAVSIHPAVIMVLLVLTSEVAGFWGMLVAVPLTAIARDVFVYLYHRFEAEEQL